MPCWSPSQALEGWRVRGVQADGGLVKLHSQGDIRVLCGRISYQEGGEWAGLGPDCSSAADCPRVVECGEQANCRGPQGDPAGTGPDSRLLPSRQAPVSHWPRRHLSGGF